MNEITLANIGEWIGKEVEVSFDESTWFAATLLGYDSTTTVFIARLRGCFEWKAWTYCRPPQPKRRVPTDQEALKRPRCWVRDGERCEWRLATLYGVLEANGFRFGASCDDGHAGFYRYCEIEDKP